LRHNINNHLALFTAAGEILQIKPEAAAKIAVSISERPGEISRELRGFSDEFERVLGIKHERR
jgi:hypothetical protein